MRHVVAALALGALAAWAAPAPAQEAPEAPLIAKTYFVDVTPAETTAFEQALREHFSRQAEPRDPWAWYTWQVVNGAHQGRYIVRSHGHRWQDFDQRADLERLDRADFSATVAPHIHAVSSWLERVEPQLSTWTRGTGRPALVEVFVYELEPDGVRDFYSALQKVHRAMTDKRPGVEYAWSAVVNGSDGPTMILALPLDNWAELAARPSSPWQAVAEEYGAQEAQELQGIVTRSIRSQRNFMLALRPDLSYEPE